MGYEYDHDCPFESLLIMFIIMIPRNISLSLLRNSRQDSRKRKLLLRKKKKVPC